MAEIPESPPHLLSLVYGTASRAAKKAYFWCGTVMLFGLILTLPAAAQSVSEWRVSKVGVIDQPTANGHVYVGAGEQVTFYAIVSQVSGWPLPDGQGPLAVLKRVTGNGDVNVGSHTKRVPSLGSSRSASMKFLMKLESEGRYTYKVCLTGLKEENGYPAAPLCGPATTVISRVSSASQWRVGRPRLDSGERIAPANQFFKTQTRIDNIHTRGLTPEYLQLWQRHSGRPGTEQKVTDGWAAAPRRKPFDDFGIDVHPIPAGTYELRVCATADSTTPPVDWACGPWSEIVVGTPKVLPQPQPASPDQADACTGGRSKSAQGICACPEGLVFVRSKCVPPKAVPTPQVVIPEKTPIRCSGGTVSNGACLCPRGFTRRTIKTGVYVCKPPAKAPVPEEASKPPEPAPLKCIGGKVKGVLCWCGLGRFPKALGNNVYRCQ